MISNRLVHIMAAWTFLLVGTSLSAHHRQHKVPKNLRSFYQVANKHHKQSTGKIFLDRPIAEVMGPNGIPWLERPQRQSEENINLLIQSLGIKPGMKLADFGTGSGVIAIKMAAKLRGKGLVYGVDIQNAMLNALQRKIRKDRLKNIKTLKSTVSGFANKESLNLDLILMVDVYHELAYPLEVLKSVHFHLKKTGLLVLAEYRREDPRVPIKLLHKMSLNQIRKELMHPKINFDFVKQFKGLPRQHLVFFKKK